MQVNVKYKYTQDFLPTKRHRKPRHQSAEAVASVEVREVTAEQFPVAFIVHDEGWSYEEGHDDAIRKMIHTEIRTIGGELYKAIRYSDRVCHKPGWYPLDRIGYLLYSKYSKGWHSEEFSDTSIIVGSDQDKILAAIKEKAAGHVIYDGRVWEKYSEPMYVINTFGLGHNHGGTGFFIEYHYNPNIGRQNYFNALHREEAIAYGKQVALNRGDTDSVDSIGKFNNIEVLMPEMVKRNPAAEHGDGDPFLNSLNALTSGADSAMEAGLLVMAMTGAEIRGSK